MVEEDVSTDRAFIEKLGEAHLLARVVGLTHHDEIR
jgi:hypothetical protein